MSTSQSAPVADDPSTAPCRTAPRQTVAEGETAAIVDQIGRPIRCHSEKQETRRQRDKRTTVTIEPRRPAYAQHRGGRRICPQHRSRFAVSRSRSMLARRIGIYQSIEYKVGDGKLGKVSNDLATGSREESKVELEALCVRGETR